MLKRVISVPGETTPPPPPPPLPANQIALIDPNDPHLLEPRGAEIVEVVEEPTLRPSDIVKGMCRSMSALSARRLNSSCSDLTIVSLHEEETRVQSISATPCNRQRVLPFVPPSFPVADPNKLIKPSEYLRSIGGSGGVEKKIEVREYETIRMTNGEEKSEEKYEEIVETSKVGVGPPPPPLPEFNGDLTQNTISKQSNGNNHQDKVKKLQPLSAISIQDLNSVQLRRTEKTVATKTFSAPTRSMSLQCLNSADAYISQKTDLIAELKMSKDLTGVKKMKMEKAKTEMSMEKEMFTEITKQFTATKFVEKIPDKDNSGNLIPAWKRQMLAKKAAEKARKEMEEQLQKEAEEKRLQSIPQWKRQLMLKKEETEIKIRQTIYTPKIVDEPKVKIQELRPDYPEDKRNLDDLNNNSTNGKEEDRYLSLSTNSLDDEVSDEEPNIIPWRAQLRKTNSSLNLLC